MKFYRSWASGCQNKEDNMATFSGAAFYGDRRRRDRPRVSDDTAEKILQRIAQGNSSDLDLSDSDDDTIVDPSFSAPLQGVTSDEDESGDDGPSTSTSKSAKVSWKRLQGPVPTWIPDFIPDAVDSSAARVSWTPSDYCQYVPEEAYEKMADAMNRSHVHESGRSLNVTASKLKTFLGYRWRCHAWATPRYRCIGRRKHDCLLLLITWHAIGILSCDAGFNLSMSMM